MTENLWWSTPHNQVSWPTFSNGFTPGLTTNGLSNFSDTSWSLSMNTSTNNGMTNNTTSASVSQQNGNNLQFGVSEKKTEDPSPMEIDDEETTSSKPAWDFSAPSPFGQGNTATNSGTSAWSFAT